MEKKISSEAVIRRIVVVTLALIPILFLPVTQDFYDTSKWAALVLASCITLLVAGITFVFRKKPLPLVLTSGTLAFGVIAIGALVSVVFASANRIEALVNPFGLAGILALTILAATSPVITPGAKKILSWGVYISAGILNLIAIYQFFGMGRVMFPGLTYVSDALWTPAGTTATALAVSIISLTLLVPDLVKTVKRGNAPNTAAFLVLASLIIAAGSILTCWQFIPKISAGHMPFLTGLTVTQDALKSSKALLVGIGAEDFVSAYTHGKPVALVSTAIWNVRFATNTNFFLHLTTIYGIPGLISALILTYLLLKGAKRPHTAARVATFIALLTLPPTITILALTAVLFIISEPDITPRSHVPKPAIRVAVGIIMTLAAMSTLYFAGRFYTGELYFFRALASAQKNEGTNTYNGILRAIGANAYISRYHMTLSQVSLSLANSLAAQTIQKGDTATVDSDRQLMSQLVEQGISEAKVAVTLNPQSILAWENLGNVYQAVMTIATGSDAWAAASYTKAISIDPTNPVLAVNLGGVLVHQKKYDDAISAYNRAILLKPDYANAYYNLANVYRLKGDFTNTEAALTKTLDLVPAGSSDYVKVTNELGSIRGIPTAPPANEAPGTSQLTLPL